jgi:hypothetical protein
MEGISASGRISGWRGAISSAVWKMKEKCNAICQITLKKKRKKSILQSSLIFYPWITYLCRFNLFDCSLQWLFYLKQILRLHWQTPEGQAQSGWAGNGVPRCGMSIPRSNVSPLVRNFCRRHFLESSTPAIFNPLVIQDHELQSFESPPQQRIDFPIWSEHVGDLQVCYPHSSICPIIPSRMKMRRS